MTSAERRRRDLMTGGCRVTAYRRRRPRESPHERPEARVAAAVGLFDKERPALAFSQLGPLSQTFPHAQTVRFHLGLLLLWIGQVQKAREELRLARAEGPKTLLASQAEALLARLGH